MAWLKIVVGSAFEVCWAIGLGYARDPLQWAVTAVCIAASFFLLISASRDIPVGTAYAVFVGLGASGTTLADFLFFGEPVKIEKILLIFTLLVGVAGLKLVTGTKERVR